MVVLTKATKPVQEKDIQKMWHLIDVKGKVLGRIVPEIVQLLQGKHKRNYVSYLDSGDFVVVINAKDIVLTGKKSQTKVYTRYSGYPGGLKVIKFSELLKKKPEEIIRHAASGMLPKNKHRDRRLARLYIFPDDKHTFGLKFKQI